MLENCPPWVMLTAGFAFGAVPRRLWHTLRSLRRGSQELSAEGEGSGSSDSADDS